jgi:hypothetical protein
MKTSLFALTGLCILLVGCSPESRPGSKEPVTVQAPPSTSKPLLPVFAAASNCLAECVSKWYRVPKDSGYPSAAFEPKLPLKFSELVASPEEMARFVALVEQLPPRFHSIGKLGPDDEEKTITSNFGSYQQERPKLYGELDNVIADGTRVLYVYSSVYYMRFKDKVSGSIHIAVDPETHEYAGVLRGGSNLDEYAIVGADYLRSALLAYTVANDLETASMLAHYARKDPGQYANQPIVLSLNKSRDAALEHLQVLNDRLGNRNEATGVPAPAHLQQAEAARAARAWYGVSQGRDKCIESPMSPADRIDVIKSTGIAPRIRETNSGGKLTAVEVSADDGRYETTWRFFKSKEECERSMVTAATPDKYR